MDNVVSKTKVSKNEFEQILLKGLITVQSINEDDTNYSGGIHNVEIRDYEHSK